MVSIAAANGVGLARVPHFSSSRLQLHRIISDGRRTHHDIAHATDELAEPATTTQITSRKRHSSSDHV